jgi:hypothetical protein
VSEWTPERHAAAVAREKAATAGPWAVTYDDFPREDDGFPSAVGPFGLLDHDNEEHFERAGIDADFIVGARNDMGDMLAKIDVLTSQRDHLRRREADIIEACERVADGGQYRADIVSAIQRIRRERDALKAAIVDACDAGEDAEDARDLLDILRDLRKLVTP